MPENKKTNLKNFCIELYSHTVHFNTDIDFYSIFRDCLLLPLLLLLEAYFVLASWHRPTKTG